MDVLYKKEKELDEKVSQISSRVFDVELRQNHMEQRQNEMEERFGLLSEKTEDIELTQKMQIRDLDDLRKSVVLQKKKRRAIIAVLGVFVFSLIVILYKTFGISLLKF